MHFGITVLTLAVDGLDGRAFGLIRTRGPRIYLSARDRSRLSFAW